MDEELMARWINAVASELGITAAVDVDAVLDVARDVAHHVIRPGAPVSGYLMGLAVAAGQDPKQVSERICALALGWDGEDPRP